jgi:hypothetical protein
LIYLLSHLLCDLEPAQPTQTFYTAKADLKGAEALAVYFK